MQIRAIAYLTAVLGVAAFNTQASSLFSELDSNNDGYISEVEAGVNSMLSAAFDALDVNEDAKLSKEEFTAFKGE
ncbi:EF-hand domain-containing protein [Pseudoalteromonas piratica]|uniref:EF-hand domain-containing protein n=1 Tax=Pseudoalteromonas piratica TaxID=1348114 RepID=A0A0A7EJJ1_9GAMM|nr:EF-hand domain-containing protein [Pseudoalteromonas piratica]AIY66865.1 hypothetical protein OM33_17345 [Pseudoalteromonas piratica]